ncbi:MAG: hypothetical protein K2I83_00480, partial [Bacteroidales bacterium]|nr:hypothetical protein [Bacteroidales bacterium]
ECGTGVRRYRSEDFVPNLIDYRNYSSMPLELTKLGSPQNCPTAPMVVVASIEGLPDDIKPLVHYEWRYDGRLWIDNRSYYLNPSLESDLFPDFSVKGEQKDTLYVTHSPSNIKVTCRAILDFSCGLWGSNKYKGFDFKPYVTDGAPDFTLTHIKADTVVCAGSEVTLWAQANEKNAKYKNKRKAARAAAEYEYAWCTEWAGLPKEGHCNIDHDTVVDMFNSSHRVVTPAPAVVPEGLWDDWNGVDGVTTYYLSVHHRSSDCWAYDSVQILSAPDKEWPVSLEFTKQGVWCDSVLEGPDAQKLYLKNESGAAISRAWYLNDKRQFNWKGDTVCVAGYLTSDTLSVRVFSDLVTCRPGEKTLKIGIPYHESPVDVLTLADPETAKVGEKVTMFAGAVYRGLWGTRKDDYVLNVNYRWEKRERNGSWTEVPASA